MEPEYDSSVEILYGLINLKVMNLLGDERIKIDFVEHNQFQEAYFFRLDDELARINIWYNENGYITSVKPAKKSQFSSSLKDKLDSLVGAPIHEHSTGNEFQFPYYFMYEFYLNIARLLELNNIIIERIDQEQWANKYTLKKDNNYTVITFWYNKDHHFTRYSYASKNLCAADFIDEINKLLTENNLFKGK